MLTPEQVSQFHRDGFLVLPDFASAEEVGAMLARGRELVEEFQPAEISVFSTLNQKEKTDAYFLDSANRVSFFFEEGAFDESGALTRDKRLSINKIGHALHDLEPVFESWCRGEGVKGVLRSLGYARPLPLQSMYIFKQPGIGGEVVAHQDSSFLYTSPPSTLGLWLALEDATLENGCLWALPGAHADGVRRRFLREEGGPSRPDGAPDNATASVRFDAPPPADLPEEAFVPVPVRAGGVVLLHGANHHRSKANASEKSRHAFSLHCVEGAPGTLYPADNWLQRAPDFPARPLYDDTAPGQALESAA